MPDNSLITSVYRKPTHTDLYLQWNSYHHLSAKYSVINTLRHRAKTVCSNHHLLEEEEKHLNRALSNCRYPTWALNRARININRNKKKNIRMQDTSKRPYIVVPYMKGLSETCKNICRRHGIDLHFKGNNTVRQLLVHPKDKDDILKKSGVIYRYKCDRVGLWGRIHRGVRAEHLLKGSGSTWNHHHQFMTIIRPLVMRCP